MFWSKKNKYQPDERIAKESNTLSAKMFYVQSALIMIALIVKLIIGLPIQVFCLEIMSLVIGIGYVIVQEIRKGIFLLKDKDEALTSIHEEVLAMAYGIEMMLLVVGELIFMYALPKYFAWLVLYLAIWLIPAVIVTKSSVMKGWLQWGTKKREIDSKKSLKIRCVFGGIAFGIMMIPTFLPMWMIDGELVWTELIWIPIEMVMFGVLFYFAFTRMVNRGAKKADEAVPVDEEEMTLEK